MPGRDGSGPVGQGPMSGRGMGLGGRRGSGRSSGNGSGRGFYRMGYGSIDEATERSLMEKRKGFLETQLDLINQRLSSSFQDREK